MTIAISGTTGVTLAGQFDSASTFGFKNRFINGQMQIAQRGTTGTSGAAVPTTTAVYPSVDRWFAYATGATVTVAQVAGTGAVKNNLQVTGAASVTAVGVGQRIESLNSYDLAGNTVTLSVNMSNSLLSTVTWTASYASSTDTWATKTTITTGSFTVTGTLTNYTAQIVIPAAATTGIEILFTVAAQTSGTWVIGNAQLEKTTATATTFDYRPYTTELALCQRYALAITASNFFATGMIRTGGINSYLFVPTPVSLRGTPTSSLAASSYTIYSGDTSTTLTALSVGATTNSGFYLVTTNASIGSAAAGAMLIVGVLAIWSAEL
jgi:hypothetical protein